MVAGSLRSLIVAALFCSGVCCLAQKVTIRVLDDGRHRPLPKQRVTVSLFYTREDRPANYNEDLELTTDAKGEASFALPEPPPEHLFVDVHLPSKKWTCACNALSDTEELLKAGVVETPLGKHAPTPAVAANPGEIVFLARHRSFLKQLLYPLFND